jgi:hypothetical protein
MGGEDYQSMADDPRKGKLDRDRINVHERGERDAWARKLGISWQQLLAAVNKVGPMAKDVRKYLRNKG